MKKIILLILLLIQCSIFLSAQNEIKNKARLKVFIDCSNTFCDMSYIRTEINIVDFMLDRLVADVHVLITELTTGGGGSKYQIILFGQNQFRNKSDTLQFTTSPIATEFEERDQLLTYIKLGLIPYIAKTEAAKDVVLNFKKAGSAEIKRDTSNSVTKDPWNYWVFRIGIDGNLSADEVYKSSRLSSNFSVNRITDKLKIGFDAYVGKNQSTFKL